MVAWPMRNIRIIVAYDGTDLAGYQKQPNDKGLTVQGCLEYGLSRICNEPIQIYGKEYVYTIHNQLIADPLTQRYHWHVKKPLNIARMQAAGNELVGTHDFTTLKGTNSTPADPVKTIMGIRVEARGSQVTISVIGDGFLYHMVRNIAGLLVDIGLGRRKVEDIKGYLAAKDRRAIGKTAPAQGLCLEEIFFTEERQQEVLRNKYFR